VPLVKYAINYHPKYSFSINHLPHKVIFPVALAFHWRFVYPHQCTFGFTKCVFYHWLHLIIVIISHLTWNGMELYRILSQSQMRHNVDTIWLFCISWWVCIGWVFKQAYLDSTDRMIMVHAHDQKVQPLHAPETASDSPQDSPQPLYHWGVMLGQLIRAW